MSNNINVGNGMFWVLVIMFWGTPDIADAIIYYLMK